MQWEPIINDMKVRAPVLLSILTAAASRCLSGTTKSPLGMIAMASSILLKCRSNYICKVQAMIGALLYAGHASKRVCIMQKMYRIL